MTEPYDFRLTTKMILNTRINRPVLSDPRSTRDAKLGYGVTTIREEILQHGRADFTTGYTGSNGNLTAREKCLLYGFFNAKKHYAACRLIFDECRQLLEQLLAEGLTLIDIGCGPATAGVAFADCFPGANFAYKAVDISQEMLDLAAPIMQDLKTCGSVNAASTFEVARNWRQLAPPHRKHVIVVGCYLFASDSLDASVADLAAYLASFGVTAAGGGAYLFYLNSTNDLAGENYGRLCTALGVTTTGPATRTVKYMTSSGVREDTFYADAWRLP